MRLILFLLLFWGFPSAAQIVNIEELRIKGTNDSTRWYGALKASGNYAKVQSTTLVLSGDMRVQYRHQKNLWLFLMKNNYIRAGNTNFVNSIFGHLRYNYKITTPLSLEAYAQQQRNKLLLLDSRSLIGTGLRRRFFISKKHNSRLYIGSSYLLERNEPTGVASAEYWSRMSNYLSITLHIPNSTAVIQGTTYWQPAIGFIKNYRQSAEISLVLPITKHLRFNTDYTIINDRSLPDAAPVLVHFWLSGLSYLF